MYVQRYKYMHVVYVEYVGRYLFRKRQVQCLSKTQMRLRSKPRRGTEKPFGIVECLFAFDWCLQVCMYLHTILYFWEKLEKDSGKHLNRISNIEQLSFVVVHVCYILTYGYIVWKLCFAYCINLAFLLVLPKNLMHLLYFEKFRLFKNSSFM